MNTTPATERKLRKKIDNYLRLGIMVWVVYAKKQEIEIHLPDQEKVTLKIEDTLEGRDVLPGFSVSLKGIFKSKKSN